MLITAKSLHVFHAVRHLRLFFDGERILDYKHYKMRYHEFLQKNALKPEWLRELVYAQPIKTHKSEVLFWCGSSICWQVATHILQSTCIREQLLTLASGLQPLKNNHPKNHPGMTVVSRLIGKKGVSGETEHLL